MINLTGDFCVLAT